MRRPDRSPRTALLGLRWDGFLPPPEIAARLGWRWSTATITARLQQLVAEGLVWSIVEAGHAPTQKFAHVRAGTAELIVPATAPRALRRGWKPAGRLAA